MTKKTRKCNDDLFYSCPKKQIDYKMDAIKRLKDDITSLKMMIFKAKDDTKSYKNLKTHLQVSYHGFKCLIPEELILPSVEAYLEVELQYAKNVNICIKNLTDSMQECCKKCKFTVLDVNSIMADEAIEKPTKWTQIDLKGFDDCIREANKKQIRELDAYQEIKAAKEKLIKIPKYLR